jgi:hypothetical protein
MAPISNVNAVLLLEGLQLQTQLNHISLDYHSEIADATVFGATSRARKGTIKASSCTAKGFVGNSTIDSGLYTLGGSDESLLTVFPTTITEGSAWGYAMLVSLDKLNISGDVGSLLGFDLSAESESNLVRATPLTNFLTTPLTSSNSGTIYNVGAVAAGQSLYGGMHITAISGTSTPTITMMIQSGATAGFIGPTVRMYLPATTTTDGVWGTPIAGPITDAYWRTTYTISGGSPSFTGLVWMAIL